MMKRQTAWMLAACILVLTGCASVYDKKSETEHRDLQERSGKANAQLRAEQAKPSSVVLDNVPRFTRQSIPFQSTQLLPAHIGKVTIRMPGRQNLPTIGNLIERLTNIPVTIAPDALLPAIDFYPEVESTTQTTPTTLNTSKPSKDKTGKPATKSEDVKTQIVSEGVRKAGAPKYWKPVENSEPGLELNYQGSLAGLLDLVAMHNELQWIYANGKIHFFRVVTRTLQVKTLPAATMASISTSGAGASSKASSGGSGGGGSGGEGKDEVFEGLEKTLKGMLSKRGKLQIDQGIGAVTVTDSFTNVQAMERHLDSVNRQLTRQVALTVEVLQVTLSSENQSGIDWNFVTSAAKLGFLNASGPPSLTKNTGTFGLVKQNSDGSENSLLIKALEKYGRVSSSYSSVITTMNRQPVPMGSTQSQSYLKQITPAVTTTSNGAQVIGQPGLIPGEINTGFSMLLLPIVLDSNHVLMQCGINLSSLKELTTFSTGVGVSQQSIQQPSISTFTTQQKMMVKSGDTIVLSGFENESTESRETDVVRKTVPGSKDNTRAKTTLVVLITPRLID